MSTARTENPTGETSSHGGDFSLELLVVRQALQLVDEDQRLVGRHLESLAAGLADHLVIEAQQVIAEFGEPGAIPVVGA